MKDTLLFLAIFFTGVLFYSCKFVPSDIKVTNGQSADGQAWADSVVQLKIVHNKISKKTGTNLSGVCSGTILSSNTILTAAHCFSDVKHVLAIWKDPLDEQNSTSSKAVRVYVHSKYQSEKDGGSNPSHIYDMAVVIFKDDTFKNIVPLPISPVSVSPGTSVVLIGYGCKTESYTYESIRTDESGKKQKTKEERIRCQTNSPHEKRYGSNYVSTRDKCYESMIQVQQDQTIVDTEIESPTGEDVITNKGDSGGPLLVSSDLDPSRYLITGVTSYGSVRYEESKYSCYSSPNMSYNYDFLRRTTQDTTYRAYIPGINMAVGVIELNGKFRVVDKLYDNIYTKNVSIPKTISSLGGSRIDSKNSLKNVWDKLSLEQKTKLNWN